MNSVRHRDKLSGLGRTSVTNLEGRYETEKQEKGIPFHKQHVEVCTFLPQESEYAHSARMSTHEVDELFIYPLMSSRSRAAVTYIYRIFFIPGAKRGGVHVRKLFLKSFSIRVKCSAAALPFFSIGTNSY